MFYLNLHARWSCSAHRAISPKRSRRCMNETLPKEIPLHHSTVVHVTARRKRCLYTNSWQKSLGNWKSRIKSFLYWLTDKRLKNRILLTITGGCRLRVSYFEKKVNKTLRKQYLFIGNKPTFAVFNKKIHCNPSNEFLVSDRIVIGWKCSVLVT